MINGNTRATNSTIVNITGPSASPDVIVFVALQEVLLPTATADAVTPPKVTVGGSIFSEEVKLSVTVLPVVAKDADLNC